MMKKTAILTAMLLLCVFGAGANALPDAGINVAGDETVSDNAALQQLRNAFVKASLSNYAVSDETTMNYIEYSDYGSANDVLLLQLYMSVYLPEAEYSRVVGAFDFDKGCWTDIDYSSQDRGKWQATLHLTRLYALTKLYRSETSPWQGSGQLHDLIHSALAYWFATDPINPNWWHNEIGVPRKIGSVLLMIYDELTEEEMEGGLRILDRSKFGMTGQNKSWLAGNNLIKGLLTNDMELVLKARDTISEEICISEGEGIRDDWSFQQHGPQMQFGNYGIAYADGIAFWLRVLAGTPYQFSQEQLGIFSGMFREGLCWCVYKGVFDPSASGRQNFINGGRGKSYALAVAARNMAEAMESEASFATIADAADDPKGKELVERFSEEADFYNGVADDILSPAVENHLVGARYFYRSDYGVYRTPSWFSSVRMHSERTVGFEFTNRENTLGNFSADGAVLLLQDGNELENIFACWDWRKVPGVTSYDDGKPIKSDDKVAAKRNHSAHVGGRTAETSEGTVLAATMELSRDGLHALKSAFFFADCIVELGADITADSPDFRAVTTAVDQTKLLGATTFDKDSFDVGGDRHDNVLWVHHNDRGYVSLDGGTMKVSEAVQKGKWDYIDPAYHEKWDEMPVFKCWLDHDDALKGEACGYAFAIVPCVSAKETEAFFKKIEKGGSKSPVNLLLNTSECQAAEHGKVIVAVLHRAGRYDLGPTVVESDRPCILIRDLSTSTDTVEYLPEVTK